MKRISFQSHLENQMIGEKEVNVLDEKRKGEIALAAIKAKVRQEMALRDIANVKRNIGNSVKEPEMVAINATAEELLELTKSLLEEVFQKQMKAI
jgi:hypothetical protein